MNKCIAVMMLMIMLIGCACASAEIWTDMSEKTDGVWNEEHTEIIRPYTPAFEYAIQGLPPGADSGSDGALV